MTETNEKMLLEAMKDMIGAVQNTRGTAFNGAILGLDALAAATSKTKAEIRELYGEPPYELRDGRINGILTGENQND